VLRQPRPEDLVGLQEALLALPAPVDGRASLLRERALTLAEHFYVYLVEVRSKTTARGYNQLASWLDIGAVGVVAFEHLLAQNLERLVDLLPAVLAESLMVVASRQYVKAWEEEARLIHREASWHVREALWRLTEDFQTDLTSEQRLALIRRLLSPLQQEDLAETVKVLLIGRLYQVLLLAYVDQLITDRPQGDG
jgi:hypothetical protein